MDSKPSAMISLKRRVEDDEEVDDVDDVDADDVADVADVVDVVDVVDVADVDVVEVVEGGQFGDGLKVLIEVHTQPTNQPNPSWRERKS